MSIMHIYPSDFHVGDKPKRKGSTMKLKACKDDFTFCVPLKKANKRLIARLFDVPVHMLSTGPRRNAWLKQRENAFTKALEEWQNQLLKRLIDCPKGSVALARLTDQALRKHVDTRPLRGQFWFHHAQHMVPCPALLTWLFKPALTSGRFSGKAPNQSNVPSYDAVTKALNMEPFLRKAFAKRKGVQFDN